MFSPCAKTLVLTICFELTKQIAERKGEARIEPCSELLLRSIQDPSTDARDDKVIFNQILAQAKPRFCDRALNLRGSALAGKVKAVRVL